MCLRGAPEGSKKLRELLAISTEHYFVPFINDCACKKARAGLGVVTLGNALSFLFENRIKKM